MKKFLISILLILSAFCAYAQNIDPELLKRAETGDAEAQHDVGKIYFDGKSYENALVWLSKSAEQGFAKAQNVMGVMYSDGSGVVQDHKKAFEWFIKAANQGYANAQHNLGITYRYGKSVQQDYQKAIYWYTKAAEQAYDWSQASLGIMMLDGEGFNKPNPVEGCALVYLSLIEDFIAYCNSRITPEQKAEALKMINDIASEVIKPF